MKDIPYSRLLAVNIGKVINIPVAYVVFSYGKLIDFVLHAQFIVMCVVVLAEPLIFLTS